MTALMFGRDLGLADSSLNHLSGHFSSGNASLRQGGIGNYVNASTGNLVLTDHDEILVGRGLDIIAERTYNSQGAWNDSDANGWRFGFERQLSSISSSSITLRRGDSSTVTYSLSGSVFKNTNGEDEVGQITKSGSNYVYTNLKTGAKDTYNSVGYLISSADADGNARTYTYSGTKLTSIKFGNGERMAFEYNGPSGKMSRLTTYANGSWTSQVDYSYDSAQRLTKVKTALTGDSFTTNYLYDGSSTRIREVNQSDGSKVSFTYTGSKIATVTDGTGHKLTYSYGSGYTNIKDGFNRTWTYYFDTANDNRLTRTLTPSTSSLNTSARRLDTRFYYDSKDHLTRVHNASTGYDVAKYTYDSAGNRASAIDGEGNKTEWRYSGKLLLSETVYLNKTTTPSTTRYVYDSEKHLSFVVDAEGRVTSHHYNAVGTKHATIQYQQAKYDVAALSVTSQLSYSQLESWRGAQNKTLTSRTDYYYDGRDQLTETRSYATTTTSGAGTFNSAAIRTKFVYDQHGQLLQSIAVRNGVNTISSYAYDGEGRVTKVTNGNNYSSSTVYSGNTVKVTNAEGKITTSVFDAAGKLSSIDTSYGSTHRIARTYYNANGQVAMTQSPTGQRTFYFYDESGRQNAIVGHDGLVTETLYNTAGQVASTKAYWNHTSTASWFNGTTVTKTHISQFKPAANSAKDRVNVFTYDKAGNQLTSADGEGKVSTSYYNSAGQVIKTTMGSRTQRFFYDLTGKQIAHLDAAGYLSERKYNAQGLLVENIAYKNATNSSYRASGSLSQLRPSAHQDDRHSFNYYDGTQRLRATVNAEGELNEIVYDEYSNRQFNYQYKSAISANISSATSIASLQSYAGGTSNRISTRTDYGKTGEVKTTVSPVGVSTTFSYNKVGQLLSQSNGSTSIVNLYNKFGELTKTTQGSQSTTYVYDSAGRKTQAINGRNHKTLFFYDTLGRLTHSVNPLGEVSETSYDNFGQVSETRQFAKRISLSGLSGGAINSTLTSRLNAARDHGLDARTYSITYDRRGLKTREFNAKGLLTDYTYNDFGEIQRTDMWKTTGGLRNIADYTYTARGEVNTVVNYGNTSAISADDTLTKYQYDAFGNQVGVTVGKRSGASSSDRTTATLFDELGRARFSKDALGYVQESVFNALGQVTKTIQYAKKFTGTWSTESGVASWLGANAKTGNRITQYTYDNAGRLTSTTDALGKKESYTYDVNGNKTSFTNKNGKTWNYYYDSSNRLTRELAPSIYHSLSNSTLKTTRPDTRFYYDNNGNLTKRIEGYGTTDQRATEYQYDAANRQTKILLPGYFSSSDGKVHFTSGSGRVRLTKTITYNALGLAVAQKDEMGANTYKVYDKLGRVRYEVDEDAYVTEYKYGETNVGYSTVQVIRYNNKFNLSGIGDGYTISESLAASRISTNSNDRRLTRYFDRQGRVTKVVSDAITIYDSGVGVKTVVPETQYTYNEFGQVTRERTRIDYDAWADKHFYYNNDGQKRAETDALGYLTEYFYNEFGQMRQKHEYAYTATSISTSGYSRRTGGTASIGYDRYTSYTYDALGRKTQENRWDANSAGSHNFYTNGDLGGATGTLITKTSYDAVGNVKTETNAAGGITIYEYDALGRQTAKHGEAHYVAYGNTGFSSLTGRHTTRFVYSIHGDLSRQHDQDSSGKTGHFYTHYKLDALGRQVQITNGDGINTDIKYDQKGNVKSEAVRIDNNYTYWTGDTQNDYTITKTYNYDKRGNQTYTAVNGRGDTSRYNAFGEIDASGKNTSLSYYYSYNKAGQMTGKRESNGDTSTMLFDLSGKMTKHVLVGSTATTQDDYTTYNIYDKLGRLTEQRLPRFRNNSQSAFQTPITKQQFDRWGNVIKSTNALGGVTYQRYNLNNQVVWEQLPTVKTIVGNSATEVNKAATQSYHYDKLGNQVRLTNALGKVRTWSYDSAGLLSWERNEIGAVTWYKYDAYGNKTYTKNALNQYSRTQYNKRGLVTREGLISSSGSYYSYGLTRTYAYDQAGRRVKDITGTSENSSNTVYTKYDASGNVIATRNLERVVTKYYYDSLNRKYKQTNADGRYQYWWFDTYGNVTKRRDLAGRTTTLSLNGHKQVYRETNGNNIKAYSYYENGKLKTISRTGTDGWDDVANLLGRAKTTQWNATFTSVSGLLQNESSSYTYDKMGNRLTEKHSSYRKYTRNYSYLEKHQYGGNMVSVPGSETLIYSFTRTTTNSYNAKGQLVKVTSPQATYTPKIMDGSSASYGSAYVPPSITKTSGLRSLSYQYDAMGNRRKVRAEVYKTTTNASLETKDYYYTYDAANRIVYANASSLAGGYKDGTRHFSYDNLDRRTQEIQRDGSKYNHERYEYLYNSALLTKTRIRKNTSSSYLPTNIALLSSRSYDSLGRLSNQYTYATKKGEGNSHSTFNSSTQQGSTIGRTAYSWGNGSQLKRQTNYNLRDLHVNETRGGGYGSNEYVVKVFNKTALRVVSYVDYSGKYDDAGNNTGYSVKVYRQDVKLMTTGGDYLSHSETHKKTYNYFEGYQQASSTMSTGRDQWTPNNVTNYYDRFGELLYVRGSNTRSKGHDRMLINNRDGQVLFRRDGTKMQDYYYANGNVLGDTGSLSDSNFESNYVEASKMQQAAPGTYTVNNGDTLKGIAQKLWGDGSLWYMIADANAIEPTASLKQGMSLTIPTVNSNVHNTSDTFKPYNPSDVIGKTDAEAVAPPPSDTGCAQMIVAVVAIVVAVVVAVYTAGTGAGPALKIAAAGLGAAAGNAAGQVVGIALGIQDGFDMGAVLKAGARGALAAGVGAIAGTLADKVDAVGTIGNIATKAAAQTAGNYLTNKILDDGSFSWKGMAAGVAGSIAGQYGGQLQGNEMATDFISSFAGGAADNVARQWMGIGGKREWSAIATDAFGNMIGNSVAREYQQAAHRAEVEQRREIQYLNKYVDGTGPQNRGLYASTTGEYGETAPNFMEKFEQEMARNGLSTAGTGMLSDAEFEAWRNDPMNSGALGGVYLTPQEWMVHGASEFALAIENGFKGGGWAGAAEGVLFGGAGLFVDRFGGKLVPDSLKQWGGDLFSRAYNKVSDSVDSITAKFSVVPDSADNISGAHWNQYLSDKYGADNVVWDWPKNDGFVYGADRIDSLQPGELIGRVGSERGTFVSPLGTKPESLSLRPGTDTSNLNVYRVVEVDNARVGPAAPAFDMPGYGEQIKLPASVKDLVKSGQLERVIK
ncbi:MULTISPECIES: glycohydrolase toxin TNT-related protein [unclassified Agarivorans]|uniref:glycohydrolase toxin TNT-related protein n=1 Tax=unclassified Agarivorans TaxID=2636026 RepID=UPI0026E19E8F|nr:MULTISPECIES: glycohydrolase toxin TNT-related protein [unclassified Agarivorans]MDO6687893.1 glycohydrolase toxin TNT-related protein [Agarivorans sp. 3_MG-2023]MDO6717544.1 glycohydrolase toxin TNT-related protein [Agarivorans sp. 2_MG-2023]